MSQRSREGSGVPALGVIPIRNATRRFRNSSLRPTKPTHHSTPQYCTASTREIEAQIRIRNERMHVFGGRTAFDDVGHLLVHVPYRAMLLHTTRHAHDTHDTHHTNEQMVNTRWNNKNNTAEQTVPVVVRVRLGTVPHAADRD